MSKMSSKVTMAAPQASRPTIVTRTPKMSAQIKTVAQIKTAAHIKTASQDSMIRNKSAIDEQAALPSDIDEQAALHPTTIDTQAASLNRANTQSQAVSLYPDIDEEAASLHDIDQQAASLHNIDDQAVSLHPAEIDEQAVPLHPAEQAVPWHPEQDPFNLAASTILEAKEAAIAVQAILDVYKPQRLTRIFASICYLLTHNTNPRDYHFVVDPVDRQVLAGHGIVKFQCLINTCTKGAIQLHFDTETGRMAIMTMSADLELELRAYLIIWVRQNIAGVHGLTPWCPPSKRLGGPHFVTAVKFHNKPYGLFLLANSGGKQTDNDEEVRSMLPKITRHYPSVKMIVQVQLRGLDCDVHTGQEIERRIQHIAEKSRIEVWAHNGAKFEKGHASSVGDLRDGEFRLHLLGEGTEDKTMPVFQLPDILSVIRLQCEEGNPLSGHPNNKDPRARNEGLQAMVFPMGAIKSGFITGLNKLLTMHVQEHKARAMALVPLPGGVHGTGKLFGLHEHKARAMAPVPLLGGVHGTGIGRVHSTNTLGGLLSVRRLVGRLLRH
ncbi:hypothetical protein B0T25DRAFT_627407 [Lasiosphaeria hispida]|uniref:Uncharacterized protein n=1 Tax=Lasiosphaeria hispida TaxID=260671 RepID=A0AAJ0HUK4_9PEZI|nr:hypothetical protein B0T25DRAFT_627407 [Lasiosphaeria hispida]